MAQALSPRHKAISQQIYMSKSQKSPSALWQKLDKIYTSKSLNDILYLKKQLYGLKMSKRSDIRDHINQFNIYITQLLSLEVKIKDEDQAIILLSSLSKSYETLVTTLLVGKTMLTVDEVSTALLETENMKQSSSLSHGGDHIFSSEV